MSVGLILCFVKRLEEEILCGVLKTCQNHVQRQINELGTLDLTNGLCHLLSVSTSLNGSNTCNLELKEVYYGHVDNDVDADD